MYIYTYVCSSVYLCYSIFQYTTFHPSMMLSSNFPNFSLSILPSFNPIVSLLFHSPRYPIIYLNHPLLLFAMQLLFAVAIPLLILCYHFANHLLPPCNSLCQSTVILSCAFNYMYPIPPILFCLSIL